MFLIIFFNFMFFHLFASPVRITRQAFEYTRQILHKKHRPDHLPIRASIKQNTRPKSPKSTSSEKTNISVSKQLQNLKTWNKNFKNANFKSSNSLGKRAKIKHYQPYYNDPCISKMCTFGAECVVKNVTSSRLNTKRLDNDRLTAKSGILVVSSKEAKKVPSANSMYDFLNKYAVCKCPPVIDCFDKIESERSNTSSRNPSGVICGSDGVEYANKCQLERRQCLLQRRIWVS